MKFESVFHQLDQMNRSGTLDFSADLPEGDYQEDPDFLDKSHNEDNQN